MYFRMVVSEQCSKLEYTEAIVHFTSVVQGKRNRWWPKPLGSIVRVYIAQPEQYSGLLESGHLK